MSKYRVKHFTDVRPDWLEDEVNRFIENNDIEVLKYTLHFFDNGRNLEFIGVLEYEVEENG